MGFFFSKKPYVALIVPFSIYLSSYFVVAAEGGDRVVGERIAGICLCIIF